MLRLYKGKKFGRNKTILLNTIRTIANKYRDLGLKLTLRQAYYQLVSADVIPNQENSYKNLGNLISDARLAGILDWDIIEDRVRVPKKPPEYASLKDLIDAAVYSYRLPRMATQDTYVELWVEKDALAGVLAPIARNYHAVLVVNRGYSSQSAMHESAQRIDKACRENRDEPRRAVVLYLGDLDPSGEDMVRDIEERLWMYLQGGYDIDAAIKDQNNIILCSPSGTILERGSKLIDFSVEKLALTMDQVEEYNPPPNPAKMKDTRAQKFVDKYGYSSWEVDALPPTTLQKIIEARFEELLDMSKMEEIMKKERCDIDSLLALVNQ